MASKFSILSGIFFIIVCSNFVAAEMDCKLFDFNFAQESNLEKWTDKIINRCPHILGSSDKEYCCYNFNREAHCCDATEFIFNVSVMVVIAIVIMMIISMIVSCICCLCCPCCCLYKRRHAGRVFQSQPQEIITSSRTTAVYQPIVKSHLPPGAYPVLPHTIDINHYPRSQN